MSGVAVQLDPLSPVHLFSTEQGRLQVAGNNITLTDSSLLLGQNGFAATRPGGSTTVRAAEKLLVSGSDAVSFVRSDITSETTGSGRGGDLQLFAQDLAIEDGAGITSFTFLAAASGEIEAQVENELFISGFNAQNPLLFSTLSSASGTTGNGSDVTLTADRLVIADGGSATVTIIGSGIGGDISVAADEVLLKGSPSLLSAAPTAISSSTFGSGRAGTVAVDTRWLRLEDVSVISAVSSGNGFAGNIVINATERVEIVDRTPPEDPNTVITSGVTSRGLLERLIGLPVRTPEGDAGSVMINTPVLEMSGHSEISVQNQGIGDAGSADISAGRVTLRGGASIRAQTLSGQGGDIDLEVEDALLLRTGSFIGTASQGVGDGGNISIAAVAVVALEDSDIAADAVVGDGGSVDIKTRSLLGTAFRERRTPESDITASSEVGLSGSVTINDFTLSPSDGLAEPPEQVSDDSNVVAEGCGVGSGNEFVVSGRGGLPENPQRNVGQSRPWGDVRNLLAARGQTGFAESAVNPRRSDSVAFVESTSWQVNELGDVELLAEGSRGVGKAIAPVCLLGRASARP